MGSDIEGEIPMMMMKKAEIEVDGVDNEASMAAEVVTKISAWTTRSGDDWQRDRKRLEEI